MSRNKTIKISFRVDEFFYEEFQKKVDNSGLSVSQFLRDAITSSTVKQKCKDLSQLVYEVNKIGVNLNQITYYANKERLIDEVVLENIESINLALSNLIKRYS
jgi:hypothetical protein